ncbi:MAG: PqqD family protein [Pseudomonadota bacterium]
MNYGNPKRKEIPSVEIDREIMVHDMETKKVYVLNSTAAMIWSMCDGNNNIEQIAMKVKNKFTQLQEDVLQEVSQTVEKLRQYGLVE